MLINNKHFHSIWLHPDNPEVVQTFDQRKLPFSIEVIDLTSPQEAMDAISQMVVRGAPLIGATGAFGLYLAAVGLKKTAVADISGYMNDWRERLLSARPTAVNLEWALTRVYERIAGSVSQEHVIELALEEVNHILNEEINMSKMIGEHGLSLIREISRRKKGEPVNILTHCNAGWIACIDYGTATAPIYMAAGQGIPVHVWVDETRPRNQGARLTAWELSENSIPHHLITDNAGGHLMQHGMVDMVIVGTDRTTRTGDVANKIGTYLKALAAKDNNIPFYVALPSSTIDWTISDGINEIEIEERSADEVLTVDGWGGNEINSVNITGKGTPAANPGFDVTPARLVTGLITERGVCDANEEALVKLFPEKNRK